MVQRKAVARISSAYAQWRLRRSLHAAAVEGRRARKRAPVEAALQRRKEIRYCADADAAARLIQTEWRARKMRLWCQSVDRASRRLQRYVRRRWLRHRLEREVPIEASRLQALRKRLACAPPPAPSKWPQQRGGIPSKAVGAQSDPQAWHAPKGTSALLACPPPRKNGPLRPRSSGSSYTPESSVVLPMGACLEYSERPSTSDCSWSSHASQRWGDRGLQHRGSAQFPGSCYRGPRSMASVPGCFPPAQVAMTKAFTPLGGTLPRLGGSELYAASPRAFLSPRRKHDTMR
jgi:hypothetical protein